MDPKQEGETSFVTARDTDSVLLGVKGPSRFVARSRRVLRV